MNVSRRHLYKLGFLTILTKMLFTGLDEKTLAVLLNFKGDELKECLLMSHRVTTGGLKKLLPYGRAVVRRGVSGW